MSTARPEPWLDMPGAAAFAPFTFRQTFPWYQRSELFRFEDQFVTRYRSKKIDFCSSSGRSASYSWKFAPDFATASATRFEKDSAAAFCSCSCRFLLDQLGGRSLSRLSFLLKVRSAMSVLLGLFCQLGLSRVGTRLGDDGPLSQPGDLGPVA